MKGGNDSSATTQTVESDYSSDLSASLNHKADIWSPNNPSSSSSTSNNSSMMATGHQKPFDSYGYEDASPDLANRYGGGRPFTPPRDGGYGYEDATPDTHPDYGRPRYTPPIGHGMEGRRSSYHGAAAPNTDISGINLQDFDQATSLNAGGPRRATMTFGDNLNAPPGFNGSRSRSGSNDSDFLTSLIAPEGGVDPASLQRRSSLQEGVYAQNDLMVGVQDPMQDYRQNRRNSLQEALSRNGTSPPEQMQHRHQQQQQNKWDQQQHHHGGARRSSLPNAMPRQGSMGYGQAGGRRYDQGYGGYANQPRPPQPTGPLYTVKLKRNQRSFVLGPRIKSKLVTGTYVKVEADRGEDLGIVIGEASPDSLEQPSRRASYGGFEPPSRRNSSGRESRDQPKKILRLATREEVALLATRRQEEDEMHQLCVQKVRERGLDMRIVDAEYQFDRNKLTFYFEAERRVDFRDLVRELFMICGTRIWMCQINTYATSTASRPSNEAPDEEDVNEPIIAPPSEFLG